MNKVPKTLREIRGNLTLEQFGKRVGYSLQVVQQYEAGRPSEKYLGKVCEAFGLKREDIAGMDSSGTEPLLVKEGPLTRMNPREFRDAAERMGLECHIRGHRLAARALMDLVDALDDLSGNAASAPMSAKASQALIDLSAVHPSKPTP